MDVPTFNAHAIAKHLREIAHLFPNLSDEAKRAMGVVGWAFLEETAVAIEATAPFTPLPDEEKGKLFSKIAEEVGDNSGEEYAELYIDGWTEAYWRMGFDERLDAA